MHRQEVLTKTWQKYWKRKSLIFLTAKNISLLLAKDLIDN